MFGKAYFFDMLALSTTELPHTPSHQKKKQQKTGYGTVARKGHYNFFFCLSCRAPYYGVETGRVGWSRVAPLSHRQEKSAQKEC